jgi:PAT family beta-lactamase induction signal transducer AmpG
VPNEQRSSAPRARRDLLWTSTAYFGEGLPWSFLHQMATEFLTARHASLTEISSTSSLHLAVTLKFLWSPMVDLFGRIRSWVWVMQILLGAGMLGVAALSPLESRSPFWGALIVLAIMHATHDIACDGFYMRALDRHGQAQFAGSRNAAYTIARFVGSSVLVTLAGKHGWVVGFGLAGLLMIATGLLNHAIMPPEQPRLPVASSARGAASARAFAASFASFIRQPHAPLVLSYMFLFRLGDIMMFAMSKPLLRDIGIDTAHRGTLNGMAMITSALGAIVSASLVSRWGMRRCLAPITYLQNMAIPLYILMAVVKPSFAGVVPIVLAENFAGGMGMAANSVFQMQRCRAAYSASHFALATAVVSLAATVSGWISGPLAQWLGYPIFFTVAFAASIPSLVLVLIVPKDPIEAETPART